MYAKIFTTIFLIAIIAESFAGVPECLKKFNVPEDILQNLQSTKGEFSVEQKRAFTCSYGCMLSYIGEREKTNNFRTMTDILNSKKFANVEAKKQKLNACSDEGLDECKFVECLDIFSPTWADMVDSLIHPKIKKESP